MLTGRRSHSTALLGQLMVIVVVPMADMKANKTETVWKTPSLNVQTLERNAC